MEPDQDASLAERARIVALDKLRVWRPYTEMGDYRKRIDPLVVVEARGSQENRVDNLCQVGPASATIPSTQQAASR